MLVVFRLSWRVKPYSESSSQYVIFWRSPFEEGVRANGDRDGSRCQPHSRHASRHSLSSLFFFYIYRGVQANASVVVVFSLSKRSKDTLHKAFLLLGRTSRYYVIVRNTGINPRGPFSNVGWEVQSVTSWFLSA